MLRLCVVALQMLLVASESGHAHGEEDAFEWAGVFETPENVYLWTAQKVQGNGAHVAYADATMKIAALPASAATEKVLHELEGEGNHALEMNCTQLESGGTVEVMEDACYVLVFKQDWWQSLYTINARGHSAIAFFTEHFPTEFENTAHYLKDDHGDDIEPLAELPEAEAAQETATAASNSESDTPWGAVMAAAVIVNIVTLVGVIFLVPVFAKLASSYAVEFEGLVSGFAAGALLACAFFLLLFEATHLINEGHKEEVAVIWRWGTMILAGFLLPGFIQMITSALFTTQMLPFAAGDEAKLPADLRARLIGGVLVGDFFHNLCDGFFIGAAFKGCGTSFGWTVAGSTIAHELAQEFSDYFILTGPVANLRPVLALALNFLSGISVLLGAIIILASDIPNEDIGLLLAFGGGVYVHIAATECMPRIYSDKLSVKMRALSLLMFVVGAIAIGLVLLDHEHCVPQVANGAVEAPKTGHEGHHHR